MVATHFLAGENDAAPDRQENHLLEEGAVSDEPFDDGAVYDVGGEDLEDSLEDGQISDVEAEDNKVHNDMTETSAALGSEAKCGPNLNEPVVPPADDLRASKNETLSEVVLEDGETSDSLAEDDDELEACEEEDEPQVEEGKEEAVLRMLREMRNAKESSVVSALAPLSTKRSSVQGSTLLACRDALASGAIPNRGDSTRTVLPSARTSGRLMSPTSLNIDNASPISALPVAWEQASPSSSDGAVSRHRNRRDSRSYHGRSAAVTSKKRGRGYRSACVLDNKVDVSDVDEDTGEVKRVEYRGRGPPRWDPRKKSRTTQHVDVQPPSIAPPDAEPQHHRKKRTISDSSCETSSAESSHRHQNHSTSHQVSHFTSRKKKRRRDAQAKSTRWQHEVYVGNVPPDASVDAVMQAFEELFDMLPEFHKRYPAAGRSSRVCVHRPRERRKAHHKYLFLEFIDAVLAATAVAMSGLKVEGCSLRVGRPTDTIAKENLFAPGLDVQILRKAGKLPWRQADGAMMLDEVWVGGEKQGLCLKADDVKATVTKALYSIPSVREHFKQSEELVISVKPNETGRFCFLLMANEVIASTLVALREVELDGGRARTGWGKGAKDPDWRAPPSLQMPAFTSIQHRSADVCSDSRSHKRYEYEVYVGGMEGLDACLLWDAFNKLFQSLPSFKAAYPDGEEPVLKVQARCGGNFSFVTMRDPVLAATAVKIKHMQVVDQKVFLARPANFRPPPEGADCLEIPPELLDDKSDPSEADDSSSDAAMKENLSSLPTPARLAQYKRAFAAPPPPPPPAPLAVKFEPVGTKLRIGNLPHCGADNSLLEAFLSHQALEAPGFDVESGPPIRRVSVHHSRRFAFAYIRDYHLAEQLLPIYMAEPYFGHYLQVEFCRQWSSWSRSADNEYFQIRNWHKLKLGWKPSQIGEEEMEFHDLGAAVANLDMTEL